ncbi:MAG: hypothetical protein WCO42_07645 [bacterium]
MTTLSVGWFLLITLTTIGVSVSIFFALRDRSQQASAITRTLLVLAILASGFLLLRPHEDTFTGLDTSCYRLMARSFSEGRQLHDTDRTLQEIPTPLRRAVLLEFKHWGRDTRDRSFEITSLQTCDTQPYFYPFLPMAATGLDRLTGKHGGDYFVPLMGLLVFSVILFTGMALGNKYGLLASIVLLIGTPLPAYLFRGYYAEAVAAGLAILVLTGVSLNVRPLWFRVLAPLALGLAVCFHPVAIVLSLPALIMILIDNTLSRKGMILTLAGFVSGLAPLWAMTVWGCQPYGNIVNVQTFLTRLSAQPLQQLLAVFVVIFSLSIAGLLFGPRTMKTRLVNGLRGSVAHTVIFPLLLILAAIPYAIPLSIWPGKELVLTGLGEYEDGVRLGYGLVLLGGAAATFCINGLNRSRVLLLLAVLLSPFFFYLKGFEPMGLWSQRRLIPFDLLLIIALMPPLATACNVCAKRWGRFPAALISGGLLVAGLFNFIQWPAPYLARHEKGATAWVEFLSRKIGNRLAFFDYYPYSVPFSTSGKSRVIGLSEYGYNALPALSKWLAQRAGQEEVLWVTAYSNPGLEDGVVLESLSHETVCLDHIVSKTALPAECQKRIIDVDIMRGIPASNDMPLVVHKILDDGPLALRGSWGCRSPIRNVGAMMPARWSREGSGIVGPIPKAGQTVRITLEAAASRDDGLPGQVLKIQPPWGGPVLSLAVSNDLTRISGIITRPANSQPVPVTGVYWLSSASPYDPAKAGIGGYETDLGARIHLIVIETNPDHE